MELGEKTVHSELIEFIMSRYETKVAKINQHIFFQNNFTNVIHTFF